MEPMKAFKNSQNSFEKDKNNFYIPWKGYSTKINENQVAQKIWFLPADQVYWNP